MGVSAIPAPRVEHQLTGNLPRLEQGLATKQRLFVGDVMNRIVPAEASILQPLEAEIPDGVPLEVPERILSWRRGRERHAGGLEPGPKLADEPVGERLTQLGRQHAGNSPYHRVPGGATEIGRAS